LFTYLIFDSKGIKTFESALLKKSQFLFRNKYKNWLQGVAEVVIMSANAVPDCITTWRYW